MVDHRGVLLGLYFVSPSGQLCKVIGIGYGNGPSPWQACDLIKVLASGELFTAIRESYAKRCRLATKDEIELHLKHAKVSRTKS